MNIKVKSKVDLWFKIVIFLTISLMIWCMFLVKGFDQLILLFIFGFITIFLLSFLFYTYYELREEYIYVREGMLWWKIKYDNIKSLKLAENLYSSSALSRKRIEIKEKGKGFIAGTTYISPINREKFLEELKKRCYKLDN